VEFEEYYRCYVVGQEKVHIMKYDPKAPHHERYVKGNPAPSTETLRERMVKDALSLCRALGYDLNTVEFAVEGGVPYAIDFLNPAPDGGQWGECGEGIEVGGVFSGGWSCEAGEEG
jgi:hypothetical protein